MGAALLVVGVLVVARARRREQHHVARPRRGGGERAAYNLERLTPSWDGGTPTREGGELRFVEANLRDGFVAPGFKLAAFPEHRLIHRRKASTRPTRKGRGLLQSFADLRSAAASATSDDDKLESALSTAEQIGVLEDAVLHGHFFGERKLEAYTLARSLVGTLVRRVPEDVSVLNKFWHAVVEKRSKEDKGDWSPFSQGGKDAMATMT